MVLDVLDSSSALSKLGIKVASKLEIIPAILSGISIVMQSVAFLQFIMEEAIQAMSHSIELLISANNLPEARILVDHLYNRYYLPFIDFHNNYHWLSPYVDDAWFVYADSVLLMIIGLKNKVGSA
jgi:hypothetical protein